MHRAGLRICARSRREHTVAQLPKLQLLRIDDTHKKSRRFQELRSKKVVHGCWTAETRFSRCQMRIRTKSPG